MVIPHNCLYIYLQSACIFHKLRLSICFKTRFLNSDIIIIGGNLILCINQYILKIYYFKSLLLTYLFSYIKIKTARQETEEVVQ